MMMFPDLAALAVRFWGHVERGTGCWLWTGSGYPPPWNYGRFHVGNRRGKRMVKAPRVAWLLTHGPIPDGLWVLHHCDTPRCVRPDHLFLGDHVENMQDMARKGRGRDSAGVANPNRRLSPADVAVIRSFAGILPQDILARQWGMSQTQISRIVRRVSWGEEG